MIGDVPCWAFDMHVREGNKALRAFLHTNCETARWIKAHIPSHERVSFLGGVLFRVESGLVSNRLRWRIGDELRHTADLECHGPSCPDATEVLRLLQTDLPLLNQVRVGQLV
jgi:hypothetical protein